ncbi:MAG TPA: SH3 domain-containing protein [Acidiphilium sp.]|uniref:SH3 domain-containing protein n=1 Tax=unclassified Acidiphilium TaxID=2617493 RepID=UPI001EFF128B|nr:MULTISPECIES: SH3 domain-containing protein [unclassified Acidiphilium]HQT60678.1 SH3 domain-containing protein [Acidiphilium sp.]HQU10887.1 SH3 domain-containing protein [Acidiphilium sp.]
MAASRRGRFRLLTGAALAAAALLLGAWQAPPAGTGPGPAKGSATGWPVPRFESFRSKEIYMRAGPGFQYPIVWVYHRFDLPVEVTGEFNVWRHVVAPDGGDGWVHEALLHGVRSFIVTATRGTLRAAPRRDAAAVAYLDKGVLGVIRSCQAGATWCRVEAGHRTGWLRRDAFWGSFAGEAVK